MAIDCICATFDLKSQQSVPDMLGIWSFKDLTKCKASYNLLYLVRQRVCDLILENADKSVIGNLKNHIICFVSTFFNIHIMSEHKELVQSVKTITFQIFKSVHST